VVAVPVPTWRVAAIAAVPGVVVRPIPARAAAVNVTLAVAGLPVVVMVVVLDNDCPALSGALSVSLLELALRLVLGLRGRLGGVLVARVVVGLELTRSR